MPSDIFFHDSYCSIVFAAAMPTWLPIVWLFILGTIFGSFLNVVVYRLPRHISLISPGSRCPACQHPIRWYDNVPVIGWFLLRGRCRDCKAAIAGRYPLVEALVGVIFALLGWLEITAAGVNLPERPLETEFAVPPSDWLIYAYHLILICTLVCVALMETDGHRPPWPLLLVVLAIGLVLPIQWLHLRPVELAKSLPDLLENHPNLLEDNPRILAIVEGLCGLGAGMLMGVLAWPATRPGPAGRGARWTAIAELAIVGAFLGWQAVCSVAALAGIVYLLVTILASQRPGMRRIGWSTCLTGVSFVWIAGWTTILGMQKGFRLPDTLGPGAEPILVVYAGAVVAAASLLTWGLRRLQSPQPATA